MGPSPALHEKAANGTKGKNKAQTGLPIGVTRLRTGKQPGGTEGGGNCPTFSRGFCMWEHILLGKSA